MAQCQGTETGAGLLVVVHLKVSLPAGVLLIGNSDVGWSCRWHMNSESISQNSSCSGVVISDRTCFAFAHNLLV
jgi:hypothetical protein